MNRKRSKQVHLGQPEIGLKKDLGDTPANPFAAMFWKVNNIPIEVRDAICKQCDWSVPTFYRKLRVATKPPDGEGKVRGVSGAELTSIKAIYLQIFEETLAALKAINTKASK